MPCQNKERNNEVFFKKNGNVLSIKIQNEYIYYSVQNHKTNTQNSQKLSSQAPLGYSKNWKAAKDLFFD